MDRLLYNLIEFHIQVLFHNLIGFMRLNLSSCLIWDIFCHRVARVNEVLILKQLSYFMLYHEHLGNLLVLSLALFHQKVGILPRILNKSWDIANTYSKLLWDKEIIFILNDDTLDDSELVMQGESWSWLLPSSVHYRSLLIAGIIVQRLFYRVNFTSFL